MKSEDIYTHEEILEYSTCLHLLPTMDIKSSEFQWYAKRLKAVLRAADYLMTVDQYIVDEEKKKALLEFKWEIDG